MASDNLPFSDARREELMAGRPGGGCDDPREIHPHWCGFCGAQQTFTALECTQLVIVPNCPRCGGTDWRDETDQITAPDHREDRSQGYA